MADDALSQADAETLLRMPKKPATTDAFSFPDLGGRIEIPLVSRDEQNVSRWTSTASALH